MGQKHLLGNIKRRKSPSFSLPLPSSSFSSSSSSSSSLLLFYNSQQSLNPCLEVGRYSGTNGDIDRLRRDKHALMVELVKLRQQQQETVAHLQAMEQRLQSAEKKQQQMMSFLARAMQNPLFVHQLLQQKEKRRELEEAVTKKRRRPISQGRGSPGLIIEPGSVKTEPVEVGSPVSELEVLALEMQGYGRRREEPLEEKEKELDDGFWEELISNERFDGELEIPAGDDDGDGEEEEEHVNALAERLSQFRSAFDLAKRKLPSQFPRHSDS